MNILRSLPEAPAATIDTFTIAQPIGSAACALLCPEARKLGDSCKIVDAPCWDQECIDKDFCYDEEQAK